MAGLDFWVSVEVCVTMLYGLESWCLRSWVETKYLVGELYTQKYSENWKSVNFSTENSIENDKGLKQEFWGTYIFLKP